MDLVDYINSKLKDSKLALCASENKCALLINYKRCRWDCNPQLMRCRLCTLHGHTKNHGPGLHEELAKTAKDHQLCIDCLHYNHDQKTAGLPRTRYRPCDHKAGRTNCPTWLSLKNKYLRARTNPIPIGEHGAAEEK